MNLLRYFCPVKTEAKKDKDPKKRGPFAKSVFVIYYWDGPITKQKPVGTALGSLLLVSAVSQTRRPYGIQMYFVNFVTYH